MPRGSKKRKAAKKKQENQPSNHSSASSPSHGNEKDVNRNDEKQSDVQVEREFKFEAGGNSNGISESTGKSHNGGSSSNSSNGNSSDEEIQGMKNSPPIKAVNDVRIEELENIPSNGSEKTPLLLEEVRNESLLEGNAKMASLAGDEVGKSAEGNKDVIVESDNCVVTEPLLIPEKKTSWKSCCGLFEAFSGSG